MSKRLINLITLLIVLGGVFYGYRYFFVAPTISEEAGVTVTTGEAGTSTNGEFLDLLLSVKNISLTKALFDNPIFRDRLQDYGRELPERAVGRENPFAPFGVGGSGTTTTLSATNTGTTTKSTTATSTKPAATSTPKTKAPSAAELNKLNQDLNNLDSANFSF